PRFVVEDANRICGRPLEKAGIADDARVAHDKAIGKLSFGISVKFGIVIDLVGAAGLFVEEKPANLRIEAEPLVDFRRHFRNRALAVGSSYVADHSHSGLHAFADDRRVTWIGGGAGTARWIGDCDD